MQNLFISKTRKMMKKRTMMGVLVLAACMQSFVLFGQSTTTISGKVVDGATGKTLPGVNIIVKDKVVGTITTAQGDFSITVNQAPPVTLIFSYVGYQSYPLEVTQASLTGLEIRMEEKTAFGQKVVVSASRVEESILTSPISIEKMDILDIKNTPAASFYDGLVNLKGVDFSAQSLTFKSINTRGFGANGNNRFVQITDGIDNQAPGLNFPMGNLIGINDLDMESAELIPGAASALYGPNALNGMLILNSKNPFEYQGLSAYAKTGINNVATNANEPLQQNNELYQDYGFRWAKSFNNKLAFKVTGSYLKARDFVATDTRDRGLATGGVTERGAGERGNNRLYDGVNVYGNLAITPGAIADIAIARGNKQLPALRSLLPDGKDGLFTARGFREASFVDNNAESIKLGGAIHYRINDNLELLGQMNHGRGSSAYTGKVRYVLDNFSLTTAKLELRSSEFYLRGYNIRENAGDSYASDALAARINQATYLQPYLETFAGARLKGAGIAAAHAAARKAADAAQPQPGSAEFNKIMNDLRGKSIANGGAKFVENSQLWHVEGNWNLSERIDWAEIIVGGNWRKFNLNSAATLFALDNSGKEMSISEWGAYTQITKRLLNDNLKLQGSLRYDKNEFFAGQFSPRFSAVGTLAGKHHIRGSFQRGFRIPTTQDQFIDLDAITSRLLGSNKMLVDRYNLKTNQVYTTQSVAAARAKGDPSLLKEETRVNNEFKTEKVNTFEVGYKGLFMDGNLLIDAYYYYSRYTDFIAEIDFTQAIPNGLKKANPGSGTAAQRQAIVKGTVPTQRYGFDVNATGKVESRGWALQADYTLPGGYFIGGNVAYNELISQADLLKQGFRAEYNTPKYRYNLKFGNRSVTDRLGFNINYRWQQAFLWESSFGVGIIPAFATLDAQVSYKVPQLKSVIKLGASNLLNKRYTTSFGNPNMGAIYYIQITFDEFFK